MRWLLILIISVPVIAADEFESVCVIPGFGTTPAGDAWTEDQVYVVVKRTINGSTVRYVEQFTPLDWGEDDDYCWFVDAAPRGNNQYQPGYTTTTSTTTTTTIRDEAYIVSASNAVMWLDSDYNEIVTQNLGGYVSCGTVDAHPTSGEVVAGCSAAFDTGPCVIAYDIDRNTDATKYEPDADWFSNDTALAVRYSPSGDYLYVATGGRLYQFDTVTGDENWHKIYLTDDGAPYNNFSMAVDDNDKVYLRSAIGFVVGIGIIDTDGTLDSTLTEVENFVGLSGIDVESDGSRIYASGTAHGGYDYNALAIDSDGSNYTPVKLGGVNTADDIKKIGNFVYATANGVLYKCNTSLVVQDSVNTGANIHGIWEDHNGNIAVSWATAGIIVYDSDLSVVGTYAALYHQQAFGTEGRKITYESTTTTTTTTTTEESWQDDEANPLDGETVCVYADGIPIGSYVMDGNDITDINEADYDVVIAGLNYWSIYKSPRLYTVNDDGRTNLKKHRISTVNIDFWDSMGADLGIDRTNKSTIQFTDDDWATAIDPFTGYKAPIVFPRGITRDMSIYLEEWDPIPMNIRGIYAEMEAYDN